MPVTDPIGDMLTRIRNGIRRQKDEVRVPSSALALSVLETLQAEGFIKGFEVQPDPACAVQNQVQVRLKYGSAGEPAITRIERVSRPGRRVYRPVSALKPVLRGMGIHVLSTPKGVMSDRQARQANVGGEVLCIVE